MRSLHVHRALAQRSSAWLLGRRRVTYVDTAKVLTAWKRDVETEWLGAVSNVVLQQSLRYLQGAFDKFWRKHTAYPKFKKKGRSKDSATYMANAFSYRDGRIELAEQAEPWDIRWSRPLPEGADGSLFGADVARLSFVSAAARKWAQAGGIER